MHMDGKENALMQGALCVVVVGGAGDVGQAAAGDVPDDDDGQEGAPPRGSGESGEVPGDEGCGGQRSADEDGDDGGERLALAENLVKGRVNTHDSPGQNYV